MGPARVSWPHAGLVAAGGAVGTAVRAGILLIVDPAAASIAVLVINVVGAFALGVVTGVAVRAASDERGRRIRFFFGAGVMGGFTTYSTFAVQATDPATLWIVPVTVLGGTLAAWAGLSLTRPRPARPAPGSGAGA